jgi:hypothetical protein
MSAEIIFVRFFRYDPNKGEGAECGDGKEDADKRQVDIPRIKFFAQRRYRANWPFVDGH